ncbi:MAG TPA: AAA family ATPase, partial [Candidatus Saccharimonadales bacterium]|nr:AAA family ATPase [Candidatus Saccharimonadales bacterium]
MPAADPPSNPFPGLRPFRSEEDYLFFGREDQVSELLSRLGAHRFVTVVGTSGSGKSSLVRCGLLSELQGGRLVKAGSAWEFAVMQPGGDPVAHLAQALLEAGLYEEEDPDTLPRIQATLRRSRFGLIEAVKQSQLKPDANLLLVVDQFEEIFRFHEATPTGSEEAPDFIRLLLEAAASADAPIYIVLTMRSDFLGDCSRFTGLAEAVNDGEYLIPRLTRDQTQSAIEGPVRVAGGAISRRLVQRLLNDLEEDTDQLPVLQHCLMRMWDQWQRAHQPDEPIDLRHYNDIGGMEEALSRHADEVLQRLPDDSLRRLVGRMFKALTEKGQDGRGIRRPLRMHELTAVTDSRVEEIEAVVNAYRQPGVTFLMPPAEIHLQRMTVVDISHESLMRVWTRLRKWVEEEEQSARIYRRLKETATLWKQGQAGLYHDPDLTIALGWKKAEQPNADWAGQYGGEFEQAMAFLHASQEAAQAEARAKEHARQRELEQAQALAEIEQRSARRLKVLAAGLTVVALLAGAAWFSALRARKEAVANATLASRNEQQARQAQKDATQAAAMLKETLVKNDFKLASQRAQDGQASEELAYLARAMQVDPSFWQAGTRALSTMSSGRFPGTAPVLMAQKKVITSYRFNPQEDLLWSSDAAKENPDPPERLVWDARTGQRLYAFGAATKENIYPRWTPDGQRLVLFFSDEKIIQVLEARTGKEVARIAAPGLRPEDPKLNQNTEQGRRIVVRDDDRNVRVFDLDSGRPVTPPLSVTNNPNLRNFGFTTDGRWVYFDGGDGTVHFWEAKGGEPVAQIIMGNHRFNQTWRSTSADVVLARDTDNRQINWWHVVKGEEPRQEPWIQFEEKVEEVHFLTGQPLVVVRLSVTNAPSDDAARQRAVIFDLNTRREVARIELGPASGVRVPPVNEATGNLEFPIIAAMEGHKVEVWDLVTGKQISKIVSGELLESLRFSPEGRRLATSSHSYKIMVWDLFDGLAKLDEPIQLAGPAGNWSFSRDGEKLVTIDTASFKLQVWDTRSGQLLFEPVVVGRVQAIDFLSRGDQLLLFESIRTFAGDYVRQTRGRLMRFDLPYRPLIAEPLLAGRPGYGAAAWFTPDGQRIVMHGRNDPGEPWQILILDAASHQVQQSIPLPQGVRGVSITPSALSPQGDRLMLPCSDRNVRIWDLRTGQLALTLTPKDPAWTATWDPSGSLAALTGVGWVQVWNAASGTPIFDPVKQGEMLAVPISFSPDGKWLATGSRDSYFRLIDARTGTNRFDPIRMEGFTEGLDFSPDGTHISVSPLAPVNYILDAVTGAVVRKLPHNDACRSPAFSPDGKLLAVGTGGRLEGHVGDILVWDWKTGVLALPPIHARGPVGELSFSKDGTLLVSGTLQFGAGAVQVWDVASGEPLTGRAVDDSRVVMISLNPQSSQIAAAYESGQVRLIDVPPRSAPLPAWLPGLSQGVGGKRLTSGLGGMAEVSREALPQ